MTLLLVMNHCTESVSYQESEPDETVLVHIGEKSISVNEFIRRAEYTMRPDYCIRDNYVHKKIVLNSLIAEKLFAMEVGEENELAENEEFQAFLKGRREQAMRQWLQYVETGQDPDVDSSEFRTVYSQAGRVYSVQYLNIPGEEYRETLAQRIRKNGELTEVYQELFGGAEIPTKEVSWQEASVKSVHQALYGQPVQRGDIVGPVKMQEGVVTFLKVEGWTERKVIDDQGIRDRRDLVSRRLEGYETAERFDEFVKDIMAGKQLDFQPETFYALVEIFAPVYLRDKAEKEAMANAVFWNAKQDKELFDSVRESIDKYLDHPLFRIEGEVWTVRDFEEAMKSHPLVFRTRQLNQENFAEQFQLAIVDLVRDHYLTREAYRRGYDQVNIVRRDEAMWEDQMESLYHRNQYLTRAGFSGSFGNEYMDAIENYLNPYVDELQEKYAKEITINFDAFEKIELTSIDMFATLENVPYPIAVPSFPVLTTDHQLNYGRKVQ
ncbi:MAG: hypothetical protein K9N46_14830 [Candidatus Marinimicrobia bacterium]|nr:hypothetical protein [Candidatus Neomarinimicrobiota bacterium]MCF7882005.1 hypothetical protein [Candidatus Neomarinimicrobiota bacterium]